jgi:hypothetical protein
MKRLFTLRKTVAAKYDVSVLQIFLEVSLLAATNPVDRKVESRCARIGG